ncbi:fasciclin-like arabinogalactan protein 19 [Syzygium oleosum]|uniref:fasciclin-like arabinogalactan protein 19 n=1 Tax=Syzygium oleosum TaxID=219896 RepID=UPI0024BA369D|nr:fasciclin-like arabinogalactan protein 19 [Syzygium oleosum]
MQRSSGSTKKTERTDPTTANTTESSRVEPNPSQSNRIAFLPSSIRTLPKKKSFEKNMAAPPATAALALLLVGTLALALLGLPDGAASVPVEELDAALAALRSRGYRLAANAAAASDLRFDLLSAASATIFAPVDSALFALGMALPAPAYLSVLRSHAVPRRLSAADLRRVRSSAAAMVVPTLLPSRSLRVTVGQHSDAIAVDGVELAVLGVFYGRDVAVHGLRGALSIQSQFGAMDGGAPQPVLRRIPSSIFFRVPEVASPASHVNDRSSQRPANLTDSSPPESQDRYSPSPEFPPYAAPEIQPLSAPLPAPAEISSVALMGEGGDDGDRRGRYGLPGDPAPTMTPLFNGGGKREGSLEISEPFDKETMSIEEVFDDDDDEFWDDDTLLA